MAIAFEEQGLQRFLLASIILIQSHFGYSARSTFNQPIFKGWMLRKINDSLGSLSWRKAKTLPAFEGARIEYFTGVKKCNEACFLQSEPANPIMGPKITMPLKFIKYGSD